MHNYAGVVVEQTRLWRIFDPAHSRQAGDLQQDADPIAKSNKTRIPLDMKCAPRFSGQGADPNGTGANGLACNPENDSADAGANCFFTGQGAVGGAIERRELEAELAAAAQSQIRVARSGYLPALALSATGANNASTVSSFAGPTYSLNLGVQVPVFSGFANQYDVAAASEQYRAAVARSEATKQQVIQQVFTAYYTLRTSTERVRTAHDLLTSATQSETVARERYREGVGSIVDLLVAQAALANARAQDADARWQWRTSLAQLAHDVGVLNSRGDTSFAPLTPAPDVRPER